MVAEFLRSHALIVVIAYPLVAVGLMWMWGETEERRWNRSYPQIQSAPADTDWDWPVYHDRQDRTNAPERTS